MKKKIALILAAAMVFGGVSSGSVFAEDAYAIGDVNMSGTVDASDAATTLIAAAQIGSGEESGLTAAQEVLADINKDGNVDASDAAEMLMIASQIGSGEEVALEYVSITELPDDVRTAPTLSWTKLGDLTNYPELRQALNQYTNEDDTLLTAYQNDQFINALSDTTSLSSTLNYTDLDDTNSYEAVLNVYFDLLPDGADKTEFNGEASLTRGQAMTLVTRAVNKVPDGGTPTSSESFTSKVGTSPYTDYAYYQDKDKNVYISTKQGLDSENFNAPMTTVEYTYLVVNAVYGESAETEKVSVDSMTFKSSDKEYTGLGAVETIAKYTQNPDAGIPTTLFNSVKIAFSTGAITNNTDLDAAISKTEAINILDAIVKGKMESEKASKRSAAEVEAGNSYELNKDILTCDKDTYVNEYLDLADTGLTRDEIEPQLIEKYRNPDVTESTTTTTEAATTTTDAVAEAVTPADNTPIQQDPDEGGLTPSPSVTQQPDVQQPVVEQPVETQPAPVETTPPRVETQPVVTNPPVDTDSSSDGRQGLSGGSHADTDWTWDGSDPGDAN